MSNTPAVHARRGLGGDPTAVSARQALRCVAFVAAYAVVAAAAALGSHAVGLVNLRSPGALLGVLTLLTASTLAAVYVHLVRPHRLSAAQLGFARPRWRLLHLLWQLPATVVCAAGVQALTLLAVTGASTREKGQGDLLDLGPLPLGLAVAVLLLGAVLTPLWEEVLFRGALLSGFAAKFGVPLAVLLSAAVFAAFHLAPPVMPYVFVLGLCLGYLRWFHRNLWASVAVHAANNGLSLSAVLLAVS